MRHPGLIKRFSHSDRLSIRVVRSGRRYRRATMRTTRLALSVESISSTHRRLDSDLQTLATRTKTCVDVQ